MMVDVIVAEGNKIGLKINTAKTELMKIRTQDSRCVNIESSNIKEVSNFVYLGSRMENDGDIRREINIRIGKASYAFNCLTKVWKEDGISRATKLKLFSCIVISVLLYGCESWKGLKEIEERVRRFESNCLSRILKVRWFDLVSEEELRRRTGQQSVIEKIKIARWKWYGHVLRISDDRIPKQALDWRPDGRRRVGRPKDTWRRTLAREMNQKNLEDDVRMMAEDRATWRSFVADLWTT